MLMLISLNILLLLCLKDVGGLCYEPVKRFTLGCLLGIWNDVLVAVVEAGEEGDESGLVVGTGWVRGATAGTGVGWLGSLMEMFVLRD